MTSIPFLSARRPASSVEPLESRIAPAVALFPAVTSIHRETPATETTSGNSVTFAVTFNEAVTGVDVTPGTGAGSAGIFGDFKVVTSADAKATTVTMTTTDQTVYHVTVSGLQGNGDVRLDVVDNDSILGPGVSGLVGSDVPGGLATVPLGGVGLNNGSFTGDAYHLLQIMPKVESITKVGPSPTSATSVSWTVTFSEPVKGVDAADFAKTVTNTLLAPNALTVTPTSPVNGFATSYTVSTTGLTGAGNIQLRLVGNDTTTPIQDADKNPLQSTTLNFGVKSATIVGTSPIAVAVGDVNGDGKADTITANVASDSTGTGAFTVALGAGDGTFTTQAVSARFAKSIAASGIVTADVNGDGKPDIVATGYTPGTSANGYQPRNVSVLLGNGDGTFQAQQNFGDYGAARALTVADLNGDGRPEILLLKYSSGTTSVNVLIGNRNGTFQAPTPYQTDAGATALVVADVNADGKPDVVTANGGSNNVSILLGNGTGGLGTHAELAASTNANSLVIADVNGDGRPDIVTGSGSGVAYSNGKVSVLLADATTPGAFLAKQDFNTRTYQNTSVAVADFNGDGKPDVAAIGQYSYDGETDLATSVLLADGSSALFSSYGAFYISEAGTEGHLVVADFNGDGRADVATSNKAGNSLHASLNLPSNVLGDTITITQSGPDLTITGMSDGKSATLPGDTLTYKIDYANNGTNDATGVKISVALPTDFSFVASENAGWTLAAGTLTKTISGTVKHGDTGTTNLKLHVNSTVSESASFISTTAVISDDGAHGPDENKGNNEKTDGDNLTANFDLAVTKITDDAFAIQGHALTYTIHYSNPGNQATTRGILNVTLPTGTTFDSGASDSGWALQMDGSYSLANLTVAPTAPGATPTDYTAKFVVTVGTGSTPPPISLTAKIASNNLQFPYPSDAVPANNLRTEGTPYYSGFYVTAPGVAVGGKFAPPVIRVFDRATGAEALNFLAYEPAYRDSIRVAVADLNGDGIDDIVTTTQHNGGRLRVFDGLTGQQFTTGAFATEITVFAGKKNGAFVATGDLDGDGQADIITGSALGGGTVKVYDGDLMLTTPTVLEEFKPFGDKFKGGVRVAAADLNPPLIVQPLNLAPVDHWAMDDLIVGQGYNGGEVRVYDGISDTLLGKFSVGKKGYRGGVSVAAGDVNDDGIADLIVGRNSGKPSIVEVFNGATLSTTGALPAKIGPEINPFDADPLKPKNIYGVRVAAVDVNLDGVADIITSVGVKGASQVKIFDGRLGKDGKYHELLAPFPAYSEYPDVALWVAGSSAQKIRIVINPT